MAKLPEKKTYPRNLTDMGEANLYGHCRDYETEKAPSDFRDVAVVNIYQRKGNRTDCTNYSGISLLCVARKILTGVITDRLLSLFETYLLKS